MLVLVIVLFVVAISLGAYLASFVLKDKNTPKAIAFIHGGFAATALILLLFFAFMGESSHFWLGFTSLLVFIAAALGGGFLIFKDLTGQNIPKSVVLVHGLAALIGFGILILFYLKFL